MSSYFFNILNNSRDGLSNDIREAIELNERIITRIHSIRRQLETPRLVRRQEYLNLSFISIMGELIDSMFTIQPEQREFEDVKVILSEEDFNKFDKIEKVDDCSICMENKEENGNKLPCGHIFHSHCIKKWLCEEKVTCPVCRQDVRKI